MVSAAELMLDLATRSWVLRGAGQNVPCDTERAAIQGFVGESEQGIRTNWAFGVKRQRWWG